VIGSITVVTDPDPTRCAGFKSRYAVRCTRRGVTHSTQLCHTHRDQDFMCRVCRAGEPCPEHGGAA
jgi:hypothetical protein